MQENVHQVCGESTFFEMEKHRKRKQITTSCGPSQLRNGNITNTIEQEAHNQQNMKQEASKDSKSTKNKSERNYHNVDLNLKLCIQEMVKSA